MSERYRNLSEFFEKTGTRQDEFAARIGVGAPYVSQLARGLRTPSLPLALRIAAAAHIPVESLLPASISAPASVEPSAPSIEPATPQEAA